MSVQPSFAPEFAVTLDGRPAPAALRASVTSVRLESGLEGADRLELALVNEDLRWLDDPSLRLDGGVRLDLGYAPDALTRVFDGEIVALASAFPAGGAPTLTVTAQDRLRRLQRGTKTRWFAVPVVRVGQFPMSDLTVASLVALEHGLVPAFEPVGASLAVLLGGVEVVLAVRDPDAAQRIIRKQSAESDYDFLRRIAAENGWELTVDHTGPLGGSTLRFFSATDHLTPDVTLRWGASLLDFTPRVSTVGQVLAVEARVWVPQIRTEFTVRVGWDWDRGSLEISVVPSLGAPAAAATLPNPGLSGTGRGLTERAALTRPAAGRAPGPAPAEAVRLRPVGIAARPAGDADDGAAGDPRDALAAAEPAAHRHRQHGRGHPDPGGDRAAGRGRGRQFGGLYRVTQATHTVDSGGYRTSFEARKEIWFGSIPLSAQGANPVRVPT